MASVYLAQLVSTEGFQKWVAIKTIHPHIARESRFIQMFLNEARLAARLDHPNICQVFDFGEANGTYYIAMEYLHGEPLVSLIRRDHANGGTPTEVAARIVADSARGLHAAHELRTEDGRNAGVVHRDVSPQNLFVLYSGVSKVVDFGVARSSEHLGEKTATGEIKGKLAYMSPEQINGYAVDRRTDIWALGTVLWEATVSRRLFKRQNEAATLRAVAFDDVPRPSVFRKGYPIALEAIVMKALDRDPSQRYQTALQLARDLEQYLARGGKLTTTDDVGDHMQLVFADQMDVVQQLLRRENVDEPLEVVEVSRIERSSSEAHAIPLIDDEAPTQFRHTGAGPGRTFTPTPPPAAQSWSGPSLAHPTASALVTMPTAMDPSLGGDTASVTIPEARASLGTSPQPALDAPTTTTTTTTSSASRSGIIALAIAGALMLIAGVVLFAFALGRSSGSAGPSPTPPPRRNSDAPRVRLSPRSRSRSRSGRGHRAVPRSVSPAAAGRSPSRCALDSAARRHCARDARLLTLVPTHFELPSKSHRTNRQLHTPRHAWRHGFRDAGRHGFTHRVLRATSAGLHGFDAHRHDAVCKSHDALGRSHSAHCSRRRRSDAEHPSRSATGGHSADSAARELRAQSVRPLRGWHGISTSLRREYAGPIVCRLRCGGHRSGGPMLARHRTLSRVCWLVVCIAPGAAACGGDGDAETRASTSSAITPPPPRAPPAPPLHPPPPPRAVTPFATNCPPGRRRCGDACVDAAHDELNCGGCGIECPSGFCMNAVCSDRRSRRPDERPPRHGGHRVGDPLNVASCEEPVGQPAPTRRSTPFFSSRIVGVRVAGRTWVHVLANDPGTFNYELYRHDANGTAWERIPPPPSETAGFYTTRGLAEVDTPGSSVTAARIFAMGAATASLWEYRYRPDGSSDWHVRPAPALPAGLSIVNEPAIDAVFNPADFRFGNGGAVTVALRASLPGLVAHIATITVGRDDPLDYLTVPTSRWHDTGTDLRAPTLDYNTPISLTVNLASSGQGFVMAALQEGGNLSVNGATDFEWETIPSPAGTAVVTTNMQIRNGPLRVVVGLRHADGRTHATLWTPPENFEDLSAGSCRAPIIAPALGNLLYTTPGLDRLTGMAANGLLFQCDNLQGPGCRCGYVESGQPHDTLQGVRTGSWYDTLADKLYLIGTVDGSTYLDAWNYGTNQWENYLAPRTFSAAIRPDLDLPPFEQMAQEYYGDVMVLATHATRVNETHILESLDDGNCWSECPTPLPTSSASGGDQSLAFDASGRVWAANMETAPLPLFPISVLRDLWLTSRRRGDACTAWTTPYSILDRPAIRETLIERLGDRPQLIADHRADHTGWLYMTYVAERVFAPTDAPAYFTYCASGCDEAATAQWCPPMPLPTGNCHGSPNNDQGAGCLPAQTADGRIFVTVANDDECIDVCNPPGSTARFPDSVGIREVVGLAPRCPGRPGCDPLFETCPPVPRFRPPACLCYVRNYPGGASQANGGVGAPGYQRGWNVGIEASRDRANPLLVITAQTRTDIDSFGPCTSAPGSRCRSEIYVAWREGNGPWCGRTCVDNPNPDTMLPIHPLSGGVTSSWRDHVIGASAVLDYGQIASGHIDFDSSADNLHGYLPSSTVFQAVPSLVPPVTTQWLMPGDWLQNGFNSTVIGDYYIHAAARHHVHMTAGVTVGTTRFLMEALLSARDHTR